MACGRISFDHDRADDHGEHDEEDEGHGRLQSGKRTAVDHRPGRRVKGLAVVVRRSARPRARRPRADRGSARGRRRRARRARRAAAWPPSRGRRAGSSRRARRPARAPAGRSRAAQSTRFGTGPATPRAKRCRPGHARAQDPAPRLGGERAIRGARPSSSACAREPSRYFSSPTSPIFAAARSSIACHCASASGFLKPGPVLKRSSAFTRSRCARA